MAPKDDPESASPPDGERPSQSLGDAAARLIREQIRVVMREEMRAAAASSASSQPAEQEDQPPSYASAATDPSRHSESGAASDEMHSEAARLLAEDPSASTETKKAYGNVIMRTYWRLPGPVRFAIIVLPFVAMIVLMPVLCLNGDVLAVSVVSFFLILANFLAACIATMVAGVVIGFDIPKEEDPPAPETNGGSETAGLGITLYIFLTWAFSAFIMWRSFAAGDRTMVPRYLLAGKFDGKITQHDALGFVTSCMYEMVPHRNATIDDISACLKKLGMPQTIIP